MKDDENWLSNAKRINENASNANQPDEYEVTLDRYSQSLPLNHRNGVLAFLSLTSPEISKRSVRRTCIRLKWWSIMSITAKTFAVILFLSLIISLLLIIWYDIKAEDVRALTQYITDGTSTKEPLNDVPTLHINTPKTTPFPRDRISLGTPFNPEEFDNTTVNPKRKITILYWSKIRGFKARIQRKAEYERDPHVWPFTYAGDTCPVDCELTNDRNKASKASAFVIHSRLTDVWDFPPFEYLAPWILQNNENPVYTPALHDSRIMSKFNLLISYRLDSDFPSPIYPKPSLEQPMEFRKRLGLVLAVFSKCEPVRTEYMRQLMNYIQVDSYGSCLKNKEGLIGLYGQINGKYVFKDYKMVLTRYYKFSLVFMNQDCDYFVDDRLYHALDAGSIPIYMGTNKIDEFLPGNLKNSIIKVSDFKTPKQLADYLYHLSQNETAFNEYLLWKKIGLGDINNTIIGRWWNQKYPMFCQVCMRLAQGGLHQGLARDYCRARTYEDWGLQPPYLSNIGVIKTKETTQKNKLARAPYAILGVLLSGFVLGFHGLKYAFVVIKTLRGIL